MYRLCAFKLWTNYYYAGCFEDMVKYSHNYDNYFIVEQCFSPFCIFYHLPIPIHLKNIFVASLVVKIGTICGTIFYLIFDSLFALETFYRISETPCVLFVKAKKKSVIKSK